MPIKFQKDVSTHLFKYLRQIDISFNPFDARTRSARELLRQVQATRFSKANPNLKIHVDVHSRADRPMAKFLMVDDSEQVFETHEHDVKEIMFQVHLKAMKLDADYELSGKSIDES
ncbi:hypothetical protein MPSEU_000088900 [Mayamaea pseudoterrestris]|nr:hypothetical protein MPSEU_000088900 [Mayamaea pseudoterrestris]